MVETQISLNNIDAIFDKFKPKIHGYTQMFAKKYGLDAADVESSLYHSLWKAVKRWDPKRKRKKNCSFSTFFWTHANCNLINLTQNEHRKHVTADFEQLKNPCDKCKADPKNLKKKCTGSCYKSRLYKRNQVQTHALIQHYNASMQGFEQWVRQQDIKEAFMIVVRDRPQYKGLIDELNAMLLSGEVSKHRLLSETIKNIAHKEHKRTQTIYNKFMRVGKLVKDVLNGTPDSFKNRQYQLYNIERHSRIREASMAKMAKLVCTKCGQKRGATSERYKKLVQKAGGEEQLKKGYVCRDCKKTLNEKEASSEVTQPTA